jgi:hypothetical protein
MIPKKRTVRIFIGSSSENREVVGALEAVLGKARRATFQIDPARWDEGVFKLSAAYIESLEGELDLADFAILVLTPDDVTRFRETDVRTPRDNVLFELGLFMGRLQRERCFMLYARDDKPKLPSDLLGIKAATYKQVDSAHLEEALLPVCKQVLDAVAEVLERPSVSSFIGQIAGEWWERIQTKSESELSFFTIRPIEKYQSLEMRGDHFDGNGRLIGNWKSAMVSVLHSSRSLFYLWEGGHLPTPEGGASKVQGFGTFEFDYAAGRLEAGRGSFVDVDPSHPVETQSKTVLLKRVAQWSHVTTMTRNIKGATDARKALVKEILGEW